MNSARMRQRRWALPGAGNYPARAGASSSAGGNPARAQHRLGDGEGGGTTPACA